MFLLQARLVDLWKPFGEFHGDGEIELGLSLSGCRRNPENLDQIPALIWQWAPLAVFPGVPKSHQGRIGDLHPVEEGKAIDLALPEARLPLP